MAAMTLKKSLCQADRLCDPSTCIPLLDDVGSEYLPLQCRGMTAASNASSAL